VSFLNAILLSKLHPSEHGGNVDDFSTPRSGGKIIQLEKPMDSMELSGRFAASSLRRMHIYHTLRALQEMRKHIPPNGKFGKSSTPKCLYFSWICGICDRSQEGKKKTITWKY